jgi:hypothetical protein
MENLRNRVNIQLVTSVVKAKKLIAKPNYEHRTVFSQNLIAVHMKKTRSLCQQPVYLGMCILDLSKTLMYEFNYDKYDYIKLRPNITTRQNYSLRTRTVSCTKLRQMIFMKI